MPKIVTLTPAEETDIKKCFEDYITDYEKIKLTTLSIEHKNKWLQNLKNYVLEIKISFIGKGEEKEELLWNPDLKSGISTIILNPVMLMGSPFKELLAYLKANSDIYSLQPPRIFKDIQLTEAETQKLRQHFNTEIAKIGKNFVNDVTTTWFNNYKAHFRNLKQAYCEERDNPDDNTWGIVKAGMQYSALDNQITAHNVDFIRSLQSQLVNETLEKQKKELKKEQQFTKEKIIKLKQQKEKLEREIETKFTDSRKSTASIQSIDFRQSTDENILARLATKKDHEERTTLFQELSRIGSQIEAYEKAVILIDDHDKYVTALQQYLAETSGIDKNGVFSNKNFSSIEKFHKTYVNDLLVVNKDNPNKTPDSYEDYVSKNKQFLSDYEKTNILFTSVMQEELCNKLINLQDNLKGIKRKLEIDELVMNLDLMATLDVKYEMMATLKSMEENSKTQAEIKKQQLEKKESTALTDMNIAIINNQLPSLKTEVEKLNKEWHGKQDYIKKLLIPGKTMLKSYLQKELNELQEKLTNAQKIRGIKTGEEIKKLDSELKEAEKTAKEAAEVKKDKVSAEMQKIIEKKVAEKTAQKSQAMEDAALPAQIEDVKKQLIWLENLKPENLDHDNLTDEQLKICRLILEKIPKIQESDKRMYNVIKEYTKNLKVTNKETNEFEDESGINITTLTNISRRPANTFIDPNVSSTLVTRNPKINQSIYIKKYSIGSFFNYIREHRLGIFLFLAYLNKEINSQKIQQSTMCETAIQKSFQVQSKINSICNERTAVVDDEVEKRRKRYAKREQVKLNLADTNAENKNKQINILTRSVLESFIADFNQPSVESKLIEFYRKPLTDTSMALFQKNEWREKLNLGIDHPIHELLYMLAQYVEKLQKIPYVENKDQFNTAQIHKLTLIQYQEPLKNLILLLEKYQTFYYDPNNDIKIKSLLKSAKELSSVIPAALTGTMLEACYNKLNGFAIELKACVEHEKYACTKNDTLKANAALLEEAFNIGKQLSSMLALVENWIDEHRDCPVYGLVKLQLQVETIIQSVGKNSEINNILENEYLSKIKNAIAAIHFIYGRSESEGRDLEKNCADDAREDSVLIVPSNSFAPEENTVKKNTPLDFSNNAARKPFVNRMSMFKPIVNPDNRFSQNPPLKPKPKNLTAGLEERERSKADNRSSDPAKRDQQMDALTTPILEDFIESFNLTALKATLAEAYQKPLVDIRSSLFPVDEKRKSLKISRKHPAAELLEMLEEYLGKLETIPDVTENDVLDQEQMQKLTITQYQVPLKNIISLLEKYILFYPDNANLTEYLLKIKNAKVLSENISNTLKGSRHANNVAVYSKQLDTFIKELKSEFIKTEKANIRNLSEAPDQLIENRVTLLGTTLLSTGSWVDNHLKRPVNALCKLYNDVVKIIHLVKTTDPKLAEILTNDYLAKIENALAAVHAIHERDAEEISQLEKKYEKEGKPSISTSSVHVLAGFTSSISSLSSNISNFFRDSSGNLEDFPSHQMTSTETRTSSTQFPQGQPSPEYLSQLQQLHESGGVKLRPSSTLFSGSEGLPKYTMPPTAEDHKFTKEADNKPVFLKELKNRSSTSEVTSNSVSNTNLSPKLNVGSVQTSNTSASQSPKPSLLPKPTVSVQQPNLPGQLSKPDLLPKPNVSAQQPNVSAQLSKPDLSPKPTPRGVNSVREDEKGKKRSSTAEIVSNPSLPPKPPVPTKPSEVQVNLTSRGSASSTELFKLRLPSEKVMNNMSGGKSLSRSFSADEPTKRPNDSFQQELEGMLSAPQNSNAVNANKREQSYSGSSNSSSKPRNSISLPRGVQVLPNQPQNPPPPTSTNLPGPSNGKS